MTVLAVPYKVKPYRTVFKTYFSWNVSTEFNVYAETTQDNKQTTNLFTNKQYSFALLCYDINQKVCSHIVHVGYQD